MTMLSLQPHPDAPHPRVWMLSSNLSDRSSEQILRGRATSFLPMSIIIAGHTRSCSSMQISNGASASTRHLMISLVSIQAGRIISISAGFSGQAQSNRPKCSSNAAMSLTPASLRAWSTSQISHSSSATSLRLLAEPVCKSRCNAHKFGGTSV